jgi:hypothetical protein
VYVLGKYRLLARSGIRLGARHTFRQGEVKSNAAIRGFDVLSKISLLVVIGLSECLVSYCPGCLRL